MCADRLGERVPPRRTHHRLVDVRRQPRGADGVEHDEAEAGHALHEGEDPFAEIDWSNRDIEAIRRIVETVYDRLDGMHNCYATTIAAARKEELQH